MKDIMIPSVLPIWNYHKMASGCDGYIASCQKCVTIKSGLVP